MDCSLLSSPFSSPNVAALLKIKIISWSQETGLPVSVCVRIADRTFNLHKHPLTCKSGYLKEKLNESNEVTVPSSFPGGPETFEMIALFMYGSTTLVDPFNVAALRCAAEFLRMTEDYGSGNLCERFDIYLNQVVLQSWDDTLIVLQKCRTLLPWAEELLIVSRCIETLAFMACMEILDPERRREHPVVTIKALAHRHWTNQRLKDILSHDLWIKDLIALPFPFFKRIIGSLRRQGMKEKYVSPIILFYVNKWILSSSRNEIEGDELSIILEGIIDLLPMGERASKLIPVYFYFHLLSKSLELDLRNDRVEKLQHQIASLLHLAQVEDFLLPKNGTNQPVSSSRELSIMESIVSKYVSSYIMESNHTPPSENNSVAELWDFYLSRIATDLQLGCKRLMDLIETIPISSRQSHDHLYKTLNNFLLSHPHISQEEKGLVCKYLNCQKLSQQVCIEAVQNELMPLRLIVQALFVQQLNTQQAFRECSDSFRYANCGEFSGSLSSSRHTNSKTQNLGESPNPYKKGSEGRGSRSLSSMLQKDLTSYKSEFRSELPKKEYESTSFRIQNLENELMSLKRSLQLQQLSKKNEKNTKKTQPYGLGERRMSKKKNPLGQVSAGCIGTVNFASQRNYANILFKVLQKISFFARRRSKRKQGSAGLRSNNIQKTE
ncbi:BTB/POZ domain-containing protein [Abeliophyllum distichum]|uniref:BTB/POZ domain-containing protein n=1 Tax=Abeliophyllum distichum TaxID=126358 RepID=A0ABD1PM77_9LAMI